MKSNLIDIQIQIENLQKQAADIRSREFDVTVKEILQKMQAFGITLNDLRVDKQKAIGVKKPQKNMFSLGVAKSTRKPAVSTVAPKYKGPAGEIWSGRGLMPRWMSALVAQGRTKNEFAI